MTKRCEQCEEILGFGGEVVFCPVDGWADEDDELPYMESTPARLY